MCMHPDEVLHDAESDKVANCFGGSGLKPHNVSPNLMVSGESEHETRTTNLYQYHRASTSGPGTIPKDSAICRVATILFNGNGATFTQLLDKLAVSRTTAIRWLSLMEAENLLERDHLAAKGRGRPRVVYHPTEHLRRRVKIESSQSSVTLSFATLRSMCRYASGEGCGFAKQSVPCDIGSCPHLS